MLYPYILQNIQTYQVEGPILIENHLLTTNLQGNV